MNNLINCPLRKALKAFGGKWNLIIIKSVGNEELRFSEVRARIPDISEKVLIDKLKILTGQKLLIRKDFKEVPPKVSYKLSELGIKASVIVEQIVDFGKLMND
ncbi:MAG: transcriptional regulator [Flavobacteriaceae bacterium]|nr:transcriptional regulator [Flavobacteriaceae bacterium]